MLILSNSIIKSASTITWWYKTQLINRTIPVNGNDGLADFVSSDEIDGQGCFIEDPLEDKTLDQLMQYARHNGPTVVKAHCHMTPYLDQMIRDKKIIATFAHRDPRDVILSAIDCRNREVESGGFVRFSQYSSIETSLPEIREQCVRAEPWLAHPQVHKILYRVTVADPRQQIRLLAETLEVDVTDQQVDEILSIEQGEKAVDHNWLEFNQAKLTRYQTEMSPAQIELCNRELGLWIEKFGYQTEGTCSDYSATRLDAPAA